MPEQNTSNLTFMAFDYGLSRTGVAIGQSLTATSRPLTTISSHYNKPNWEDIKKLLSDWQPQHIIVGIPEECEENKSLRNKIMSFCRELSQISDSPVTTHDETLTSDEAYQQLKTQRRQGKGKIDKKEIDQLAAAILLQSWMNVNLTS